MSSAITSLSQVIYRHPRVADGALIRDFIESCGNLDTNSTYFYLLHCRHFQQSCLIAEKEGRVVGVLLGHRVPEDPSILFVWQIGVHVDYRRKGLGRSMVAQLVESIPDIHYVEAHVGPSNVASQSMFRRLAEFHNAPWETELDFSRADFGATDHDEEHRIRIGPLKKG